MDDQKYRGIPQQAVTIVDKSRERRSFGERAAALSAIAEALKTHTSLPEGEGRLSHVTLLSEFKILHLVDECKARLTQLLLKVKHH